MAEEVTTYDDSQARAWLSNSEYADPDFVDRYGGLQQLVQDAQSEDGRRRIAEKYKAGFMRVSAEPQPAPEAKSEWREQKVESWKKWCEEEHTPAYIYSEDETEKVALKFDVYKTPEDKEAGKKAATIHYNNPRDVAVETEDNKAPDYEFFDKLAKEAKKDKIPGIAFQGEMTDDFKTKLAVACLANGLKMDGFEGKINLEHLSEEERNALSPETKQAIAKYNYDKDYAAIKEGVTAEVTAKREENPDVKIDIADKLKDVQSPEQAAMIYSAYKANNVNFVNEEKLNPESHGMFLSKEKALLPNEVQTTIDGFNNKTSSNLISAARKLRQEKLNAALNDDKTPEEQKAKIKEMIAERQDVEQARKDGTYKGSERNQKRTERGLDALSGNLNDVARMKQLRDLQGR